MPLYSYVTFSGVFAATILLSACTTSTLPDNYYDDIAYESAAVNICQRQGLMDSRIAKISNENNAYTLGLGSYDKNRLDTIYQNYMTTYQNGFSREYCQYVASTILDNERNLQNQRMNERRRYLEDMEVIRNIFPKYY